MLGLISGFSYALFYIFGQKYFKNILTTDSFWLCIFACGFVALPICHISRKEPLLMVGINQSRRLLDILRLFLLCERFAANRHDDRFSHSNS